jgi:hypothetical protein
MIRNNVDIWAVLLLLLGFAFYTATEGVAQRIADARWEMHRTVRPIQVRVSPFRIQTNRFKNFIQHRADRLPSCPI